MDFRGTLLAPGWAVVAFCDVAAPSEALLSAADRGPACPPADGSATCLQSASYPSGMDCLEAANLLLLQIILLMQDADFYAGDLKDLNASSDPSGCQWLIFIVVFPIMYVVFSGNSVLS